MIRGLLGLVWLIMEIVRIIAVLLLGFIFAWVIIFETLRG